MGHPKGAKYHPKFIGFGSKPQSVPPASHVIDVGSRSDSYVLRVRFPCAARSARTLFNNMEQWALTLATHYAPMSFGVRGVLARQTRGARMTAMVRVRARSL